MANINLHKSHTEHFALALTSCDILIFLKFDIENLGHGHEEEKRDLLSFDGEHQSA